MTPTEMMPSSVFAVIFHGIVKVGLAFDIPSLGFEEKKCVLFPRSRAKPQRLLGFCS